MRAPESAIDRHRNLCGERNGAAAQHVLGVETVCGTAIVRNHRLMVMAVNTSRASGVVDRAQACHSRMVHLAHGGRADVDERVGQVMYVPLMREQVSVAL